MRRFSSVTNPEPTSCSSSWKERVNPIFRIDNLDHHGKIPRRVDEEFAVDPAVGAETQRSVKDGRAGQARSPSRLDDRSVKGMPLSLISLADEGAKKDSILRQLHGRLLQTAMVAK